MNYLKMDIKYTRILLKGYMIKESKKKLVKRLNNKLKEQ